MPRAQYPGTPEYHHDTQVPGGTRGPRSECSELQVKSSLSSSSTTSRNPTEFLRLPRYPILAEYPGRKIPTGGVWLSLGLPRPDTRIPGYPGTAREMNYQSCRCVSTRVPGCKTCDMVLPSRPGIYPGTRYPPAGMHTRGPWGYPGTQDSECRDRGLLQKQKSGHKPEDSCRVMRM
eukprot:1749058-Rhodomonas_salina.2